MNPTLKNVYPNSAARPSKASPDRGRFGDAATLKLAGACLIASAAGAALMIGADQAYDLIAINSIPAPSRAARPVIRSFTPSNITFIQTDSASDRQALHLVRSTLLALDQANQTGNYSVLRALGTPQFRARNSAADLAVIFSGLRRHKIDLAEATLLVPSWQKPARKKRGEVNLRGIMKMSTRAIYFDMQFKPVGGNWRVFALAVVPQSHQKGRPKMQSRSNPKTGSRLIAKQTTTPHQTKRTN